MFQFPYSRGLLRLIKVRMMTTMRCSSSPTRGDCYVMQLFRAVLLVVPVPLLAGIVTSKVVFMAAVSKFQFPYSRGLLLIKTVKDLGYKWFQFPYSRGLLLIQMLCRF